MRLIYFIILFCQTSLALIYNDKCTKKCDFPGMICINNRCICDSKNRLFWTNARCAPCPNGWTMTETACLTYYETIMPWERAKSTCRNVQAELISFRNRDLISLIYIATNTNEISESTDKLSAWTSAYATDISGFGVYQWLDKNTNSFNNKSNWWCKTTTPNLGYIYQYNEPTRSTNNDNEIEKCVVYWRGITDTEVICLDDQLCSKEFPFVCEKSESTASQYLGPPPAINNLVTGSSTMQTNIIYTIPHGTLPNIPTNHSLKPNKKSTGINKIVVVIFLLLLLLALLSGLFFFYKRQNTTKTQVDINRNNKITNSIPKKSITNSNDATNKDQSIYSQTNPNENNLVLDKNIVPGNIGVNIDIQKQQKNRRGGYSKQNFDEFE